MNIQQALQIAQLMFYILSLISLMTIILKNLVDTYKTVADIKKEKAKTRNQHRKRK